MNGGSRHAAGHPEQLAGLLEPVINAAGFELESVRVSRAGRRGLLRVVVDGEHGVTLDDIAQVSRAVEATVDDAMGSGAYTLEVSSPGVDRPLSEPRHWRRASGRLVRVPVKNSSSLTAGGGSSPASGRTVEGRIISAGPSGVTLEIGDESHEFGYAELGAGQVQVEFGKLGPGPEDSGPDGEDLAGKVDPDGH